jgi:hypothetical protein
MAFLKYANAVVAEPLASVDVWQRRVTAGRKVAVQSTVLQKYDPAQYLLSHATIMASVDTENGPGPLGRHLQGSFEVNRRFLDYYITPETTRFINNNFDAWSRPLLLATYRTFIGAQNYMEHLQVKELSKGRIIDAVARDTGPSVYIDILVATERKHRSLVAGIESRKINSLSMGCSILYSQCSFCGNVATDDTELCGHIKYAKGNTFKDAFGKTHRVAELCGHSSENDSVKFIEASWVANPAFKGAVVRNLFPGEAAASQLNQVLPLRPPTATPGALLKAAQDQNPFVDPSNEVTPSDSPSDIDTAVDEVAKLIRQKALEKVRSDLNDPVPPRATLRDDTNGGLTHEASLQFPIDKSVERYLSARIRNPDCVQRILTGLVLHRLGGWQRVADNKSLSGPEVLVISRILDQMGRIKQAGTDRIYRTVLGAGGLRRHGGNTAFLAVCQRVLGRVLTAAEQKALIEKGQLFDLGTT